MLCGYADATDAGTTVRCLVSVDDVKRARQAMTPDMTHHQIHAGLGQRARVDTTLLPWVAAPSPGVHRRMVERDGGEVLVLGQDPATAGADWRAKLGIVLQESRPLGALTVRETLRLYAAYLPHPRGVDEVIALVGLEEQADQRAGRLSGGQQRRLDVGVALIGNPELVFLDEPTTGFDPDARRQFWDVISGLRDLGTTVFLTTHYMDEAQVLADRVAVMRDGKVAALGTPAELQALRGDVEIRFVLPTGLALDALPQLAKPTLLTGGEVRVETTAATADLAALCTWAEGRGLELEGLTVERPTLEDVFLAIAGPAWLAMPWCGAGDACASDDDRGPVRFGSPGWSVGIAFWLAASGLSGVVLASGFAKLAIPLGALAALSMAAAVLSLRGKRDLGYLGIATLAATLGAAALVGWAYDDTEIPAWSFLAMAVAPTAMRIPLPRTWWFAASVRLAIVLLVVGAAGGTAAVKGGMLEPADGQDGSEYDYGYGRLDDGSVFEPPCA